ncbi:FtsK/SpoIIIE domain-containing protein [Streptomyces globisporus]|uniref:FtsK/SpoIIIE domain-containing protein n=1 Tax=Streptomyces globisporus TaxID=1908 RepID=UPI0037CAD9F8
MTDQTFKPLNGHKVAKLHPVPPELLDIPVAPVSLDKPRQLPAPRRHVRTGKALRRAITSDTAREAVRLAVRHTGYTVGGARILTRRAWDGRSAARYERMIRAAEAAGNLDEVKEWEERGQTFREARHRRRMALLAAPAQVAKGAVVGVGLVGGAAVGVGIAMAASSGNVADVAAPALALVDAIRWAVIVGSVVWGVGKVVAPWLFLLACWGVGRHGQAAPAWALPSRTTDEAGAPITPSVVVTAMRDLGIAPLRKAVKEMGDAGAAMLGPIRIAGCGVEVDVTLPSGVATDEVQKRRRKLAENLDRHEHEVFITIPQAARTVRLWIADSGALDEPIGPSPLLTDATLTADYAKGRAPWGQDLRGDAARISLYQRHMLITGLSNQGKTAALRSLALWLALDPTVELRIADLKGAGDWAMFDGLASVLIEGPTDEHVIRATVMVEGLVQEMERRLQAPAGTKFTPLVGIVDEAQVAFMCPAVDDQKRPYGGSKALSRYFMAARKVHNQGRAVDVLLYQGTQDPTDQNLPKLVREGAHTRASLALGTESQARMALGDKAVDGGAAPQQLRQGLDKGTLVVASDGIDVPAGQASITVRTHYVSTDDAATVADRAKALRGTRETESGETGAAPRDLLGDLLAVLRGKARMRTLDVLKGLSDLDAAAYGAWTLGGLTAALEGTGAEPYKSRGVMVIANDRVREAWGEQG